MKKNISIDEKIFIAGVNGMVGSAIFRKLQSSGYGNQKNGQVEGFNYENEYESITMFPNTVTLSMMGQPMIGRGNNIFIDFGTNTSVDNIYTVKTVSHTLSEGDFSTTVTVVPSNMGSISTFKERLSDNIDRLNPNKKEKVKPANILK